jgi:hypothetical protein
MRGGTLGTNPREQASVHLTNVFVFYYEALLYVLL